MRSCTGCTVRTGSAEGPCHSGSALRRHHDCGFRRSRSSIQGMRSRLRRQSCPLSTRCPDRTSAFSTIQARSASACSILGSWSAGRRTRGSGPRSSHGWMLGAEAGVQGRPAGLRTLMHTPWACASAARCASTRPTAARSCRSPSASRVGEAASAVALECHFGAVRRLVWACLEHSRLASSCGAAMVGLRRKTTSPPRRVRKVASRSLPASAGYAVNAPTSRPWARTSTPPGPQHGSRGSMAAAGRATRAPSCGRARTARGGTRVRC
jgi:hypothetical protein